MISPPCAIPLSVSMTDASRPGSTARNWRAEFASHQGFPGTARVGLQALYAERGPEISAF